MKLWIYKLLILSVSTVPYNYIGLLRVLLAILVIIARTLAPYVG